MSTSHFEDFLRAGLYLKNCSPKTLRTYKQAWSSFSSFRQSLRESGSLNPGPILDGPAVNSLSKAQLEAWVVWMRERGIAAGGVNMYIRTMNSFCTWLGEEGHTPQRLRLKLLKNPAKPLRGF